MAAHDHLIVGKEPEPVFEPMYGQAYEKDRKESVKGSKESAGLSLKAPTQERKTYTPTIIPVHRSDFEEWVGS